MAKEFSAIGLDLMFAETIDITIMDNLSEMILVRSKTQRTRSRIELKKLMQEAVLRGEIDGWWNAHQ
jgi:D-alanyl-D-alanine dipeptidase